MKVKKIGEVFKNLGSFFLAHTPIQLYENTFDQATDVCADCNTLQDSKLIFMTRNFKSFLMMLLRQLNFGVLSV